MPANTQLRSSRVASDLMLQTPTTTDVQKARLAVNPVTGLTVSSALNFTPLTGKERWRLYLEIKLLFRGSLFQARLFCSRPRSNHKLALAVGWWVSRIRAPGSLAHREQHCPREHSGAASRGAA